MGHARFDRVVLDYQNRRRSADGSLVVRGRFARTGIQTYLNDDGSERIEYRPPDEVKSSASTFEGVAVTDCHPSTMVDSATWSSLARGHVQGITITDGPDEESWLEGDFHIKDGILIDRIERGERPELSAGYFCDEDDKPGEYKGTAYHCAQRGIVGNHVASIPGGTARAGREARLLLDSAGNQLPPEGGKETPKMDEQEAKLVALTLERDQLKARTDALTGEVDQLKAKLAEANDPKRIDAAVKARFDLVDRARRLGGDDMDVTGSDNDVRVRALNAVGVKVDGRSDAYVEARMDAEIEKLDSESGHTVADAIDSTPHVQPPETDWLQPVWDARERLLADQHGEED